MDVAAKSAPPLTILGKTFFTYPSHVRQAAIRHAQFIPTAHANLVVKRFRAAPNQPYKIGNISYDDFAFSYSDKRVIAILPNYEGIPSPRAMIWTPFFLDALPSQPIIRAVNSLASALSLTFYCWVNRNQLWALWRQEDSTFVNPIDPIDFTICNR